MTPNVFPQDSLMNTFSHLADAFIQSDLQLGESLKVRKFEEQHLFKKEK